MCRCRQSCCATICLPLRTGQGRASSQVTKCSPIAGKLGIETKSIAAAEAPQYLGFLAAFAGLDNPTSNDRTRELLGWEPTHPGWVDDVESGHYFA
jgi:hypothetical protein